MKMEFILSILILFTVVFIFKWLVKISPNERWVLERLSKYKETLDSGWHIVNPFIESVKKIDVREKVFNTWSNEMITRDNAVVTVDAVVYLQITDPKKTIYDIENPYNAVLQLAITNLRAMIWTISLDECLSERSKINAFVQTHLSEETWKRWLKVTRVEIQRIDPPADLVHSMQEQKKAEQEKRAQMLRAEWMKEAAIREAEWIREAEILKAQWEQQKNILEAEWAAQAIERLATARAKALEVESVAANSFFKDNAVVKEQLKVLWESMKDNSKYIIDLDIFNLIRGFKK